MTDHIITNTITAPAYIRSGSSGIREVPLDSELLSKRIIVLNGEITPETAVGFFMSMQYLTRTNEPINIYIYSPGGDVTAGRAIYDMMQGCRNEVRTYCIGMAASMAAVLLAAGTHGSRFILPNGEVMIHEVLTKSIGGSATSITKLCASINEVRDIMNGILANHTGKTVKEINKATSFDNYMNAEQAIEFGICDKIVTDIFGEAE
ncbi:MAG: ATP-dependent Clp protease proteolytic subunit [Ruminiclostridium sp.]|nr:ATP-dependent Clp protease proteolytic subunit [Ruminiclostridium sp.]